MNRDPEDYLVEFDTSSVFGSLVQSYQGDPRDRKANLQVVVSKQKASIRDIAASILASFGIVEAGPGLTSTSGFLAAVLFTASGIIDIKTLKGWSVDELIDQMKYDREIEQFYLMKSELKNFVQNGTIDQEFVDWLVEAGAFIDDADRFRVNKLFKKGNIINIV